MNLFDLKSLLIYNPQQLQNYQFNETVFGYTKQQVNELMEEIISDYFIFYDCFHYINILLDFLYLKFDFCDSKYQLILSSFYQWNVSVEQQSTILIDYQQLNKRLDKIENALRKFL